MRNKVKKKVNIAHEVENELRHLRIPAQKMVYGPYKHEYMILRRGTALICIVLQKIIHITQMTAIYHEFQTIVTHGYTAELIVPTDATRHMLQRYITDLHVHDVVNVPLTHTIHPLLEKIIY